MAGENRKRRGRGAKWKETAINPVEHDSSSTDIKERRLQTIKPRESSGASSAQLRPSEPVKRPTEHDEADQFVQPSGSFLLSSGFVTESQHTPIQQTESANKIASESTATPQSSTMPDLFRQDSDGDTFLHIAVVQGNQPLTEFLIKGMQSRGIDIYNNLRQTPLHLAAITCQPYLVKTLLEGGADVNMMDRHGQTALHLACQNNDLDCVNAIRDAISLDSGKLKMELKNFQGFSVLHLAVLKGTKQMVTTVLDMGADINDQDSNSGRTALHHAVEAGKYPVADYLISRGADVNKVTFAGNTALHTASGREMDDMARLLVSNGANVNIANREGDIPKVVRTSEQAKRQFRSNQRDNKRRKR